MVNGILVLKLGVQKLIGSKVFLSITKFNRLQDLQKMFFLANPLSLIFPIKIIIILAKSKTTIISFRDCTEFDSDILIYIISFSYCHQSSSMLK